MRKTIWAETLALIGVLTCGGDAHAQGLIELSTGRRVEPHDLALPPARLPLLPWPEKLPEIEGRTIVPKAVASRPSRGERNYAAALAKDLESPVSRLERVVHRIPGDDSPNTLARGVRTTLRDGTVIERFHFPNETAAFDYALHHANLNERGLDALVEARGPQIVVIRGKNLADPSRASRAFDAAWSTLPMPKAPPSVTGTYLEDGGIVLTSRRPDPALDKEFQRALDMTRDRHEEGRPGFNSIDDDHYGFDFPDGAGGEIQHGSGLSAMLFGKTREQREQLALHLRRAWDALDTLGQLQKAGASDMLGDLFR